MLSLYLTIALLASLVAGYAWCARQDERANLRERVSNG